MNTHYIPKLLLRQFATGGKINTYHYEDQSFYTKKLKNTFAGKDLFDEDLERDFASKLEGPIGDLLNHKLLSKENIQINQSENKLLRKFLMINGLRSPVINGTYEEIVARTKLENHPSVQTRAFLLRHHPELKEIFDKGIPTAESYFENLKVAMEYESIMELLDSENLEKIPLSLVNFARLAVMSTIAFWDCEESGQEIILPKLQGISMSDQQGMLHKVFVIKEKLDKLKAKGVSSFLGKEIDLEMLNETGKKIVKELEKKLTEDLETELGRLVYGSIFCSDNFSMYPISPTRMMVCFSPYFRAFFPVIDGTKDMVLLPPLLDKKQFDRHFFKPMRMELFKPCKNFDNKSYQYEVKSLTCQEVMFLNSIMLDMETDEFAFHDYNKIRDSFWYYDHKVKFALEKKHNFSHMG